MGQFFSKTLKQSKDFYHSNKITKITGIGFLYSKLLINEKYLNPICFIYHHLFKIVFNLLAGLFSIKTLLKVLLMIIEDEFSSN